MTLTWLNKQGVKSDSGYEFQRTGRFEAQYREGTKVVTLAVESGIEACVPCLIVDRAAFKYWDGTTIPNSPEKQAQMFANLKEAIEFQGRTLVVE